MSAMRGYRIYGKILEGGLPSVLVESAHIEYFLLIQSGAILSVEKDVGSMLKQNYTKLADGYALLGILRLLDGDSYLILVTGILSVGQLYASDVYKMTNVQFVPVSREPAGTLDPRIAELQRLLSAGIFYFSNSSERKKLFNLSLSLQRRSEGHKIDSRFYWNRNLSFPFEKYGIDSDDWLVQCICGSVLIRTIYIGSRTAKVALVSRLSCEHVGTRFNVRGVNDDGNVANFVETEQLVTFEDQETSFLQIRGSIPLFWEQPGINVGSHVVKLKAFEFSMGALEKHYELLKKIYGCVNTVNLLGSKKGEQLLSNAFQTALKSSSHSDVQMVSFDYHSEIKQSKDCLKQLLQKIGAFIDECQFFHKQAEEISNTQRGVIRTNCLDCLDRTNTVQTVIGMKALAAQLSALEVDKFKANISVRFEEVIKDLWQKNGDQCSVIYAGTGALEGKSKLKDASRSIVRTIQNNLMDASKQESFDLLLLGHTFGSRFFDKASNLLPSTVLRAGFYFFECQNELEALVEREREICSVEQLSIFAGTWNVNGGKNMYNVAYRKDHGLDSWIYPTHILPVEALDYDILAIGFEEIVDLSAGNLVKASTTNQRVWRDGLKAVINTFQETNFPGRRNNKYVVLMCEQLVGVCLVVFAKLSLLPRVRDLAVDEVKTGMGGTTGNKGSIAVRMTINSTSVCFVCSHFAAGQNEIVARNADFQSALRRIRFPVGRTIPNHDVIFWLGDFNYRISLGGDEVKNAVRAGNLEYLTKFDQLSQQKELGNAFAGFQEGSLDFDPTYKYDTFSDDYDTSEKCRSPAWTDRVLWADVGRFAQLLHYGRSELKTSDHRPVLAIFRLNSLKIDFDKAEEVVSDVVSSMGPPDSTILCSVDGFPDNFPQNLCHSVFAKLRELGINVLVSKIQRESFQIVLGSGVDALAALSMDQVALDDGLRLNVRLRPSDWPGDYVAKLVKAFEEAKQSERTRFSDAAETWSAINLNLEDDDDEEDGRSATATPSQLVADQLDGFELVNNS